MDLTATVAEREKKRNAHNTTHFRKLYFVLPTDASETNQVICLYDDRVNVIKYVFFFFQFPSSPSISFRLNEIYWHNAMVCAGSNAIDSNWVAHSLDFYRYLKCDQQKGFFLNCTHMNWYIIVRSIDLKKMYLHPPPTSFFFYHRFSKKDGSFEFYLCFQYDQVVVIVKRRRKMFAGGWIIALYSFFFHLLCL